VSFCSVDAEEEASEGDKAVIELSELVPPGSADGESFAFGRLGSLATEESPDPGWSVTLFCCDEEVSFCSVDAEEEASEGDKAVIELSELVPPGSAGGESFPFGRLGSLATEESPDPGWSVTFGTSGSTIG
jgi:hypothetical protein